MDPVNIDRDTEENANQGKSPQFSFRTAVEDEWLPLEASSDTKCLPIFLFFNICLCVLSAWVYSKGDPERLIRGWDLYGHICGEADFEAFSYTYFPMPLTNIDLTLCLKGCPAVTATESVCLYDFSQVPIIGLGCYDVSPSIPFYNRYCLPAERSLRDRVTAWLYEPGQVMTRVAWDVYAIGGLVAAAAMMSFLVSPWLGNRLYLIFFSLSAGVSLFLLGSMVYLVFSESWRVDAAVCGKFSVVQMDECNSGETANGYKSLAWCLLSLAVCVALTIICMIPGVRSGIAAFEVAGSQLKPHLLACPLISALLGAGIYVYFLSVIVFASSAGNLRTHIENDVPMGEIIQWEFSAPERVLVFFDVGMALWWFSFLAHMVEFVSAEFVQGRYISTQLVSSQNILGKALWHMVRYRLGSILWAAVLIPVFRLPRNIVLGMKKARKTYGLRVVFRPFMKAFPCFRSSYERWLKYMTSDGLAWQAIKGGSFVSSAVHGHVIIKRHKKMRVMQTLNNASYSIWVFQLVIIMTAPVFVAYWLTNQFTTFRDVKNREVTSVTGVALIMLGFSWLLAQIYGGYARGVLHGSVMAFLIDVDLSPRTEHKVGILFLKLFSGLSFPDLSEDFEEEDDKKQRGNRRVRPSGDSVIVIPVPEANRSDEVDGDSAIRDFKSNPPPTRQRRESGTDESDQLPRVTVNREIELEQ